MAITEMGVWRDLTLASTESDAVSECPLHPITLINRCAHIGGWFVCQRTISGKWRIEFGSDVSRIVHMMVYKDTWIEGKRLFDMWVERELFGGNTET